VQGTLVGPHRFLADLRFIPARAGNTTQHIDQFSQAASFGKRLPREVFLVLGHAVVEDTLGAAIRHNAQVCL
jgi:hypothetical protein